MVDTYESDGRVAVATPPDHSPERSAILIVDDHPLMRDSIRGLIAAEADLSVYGEAGSLAEARELVSRRRPDLIVLDLYLPDGDGLGFLEEVRCRPNPPKVLVFSIEKESDGAAAQAMRLGASGFLNKSAGGTRLLAVLRDALAGRVYLSPETIDRLIRRRGRPRTATAWP